MAAAEYTPTIKGGVKILIVLVILHIILGYVGKSIPASILPLIPNI